MRRFSFCCQTKKPRISGAFCVLRLCAQVTSLPCSIHTELVAEFPPHVAAEWLGHSTLVTQKHYWQVTDLDFQRASGAENSTPSSPSETPSAESDAIVADVKNEAPTTAMATNPEVAEIAATWANLSPAARQCMMLLIRNS